MTDSFTLDIAQLRVRISSNQVALVDAWRRLFRHHGAEDNEPCTHEVELFDRAAYEQPADVSLRWRSTLLGVSAKPQAIPASQSGSLLDKVLGFILRKKNQPSRPQPVYSGSCEVSCFRDAEGREFIVPQKADWRLIHMPDVHQTYVYMDAMNDDIESIAAAMLHVVGSQYGRYLLFASAVEENGEAVVFVGHGGAGKTTACIERIEQGAKYMGDDLVLVYLENGAAMVGSILIPARVVTAQSVEKKRVDFVDVPVRQAPLGKVYQLTRDHSQVTRKELDCGDVLVQLFDLTNSAHTHDNAAQYTGTLTDIMSDLALR